MVKHKCQQFHGFTASSAYDRIVKYQCLKAAAFDQGIGKYRYLCGELHYEAFPVVMLVVDEAVVCSFEQVIFCFLEPKYRYPGKPLAGGTGIFQMQCVFHWRIHLLDYGCFTDTIAKKQSAYIKFLDDGNKTYVKFVIGFLLLRYVVSWN